MTRATSALAEQSRRIPEETSGDMDVLLITDVNGFIYLTQGLRNPTRYDLTQSTSFGGYGQTRLIDELAGGDIRWVCIRHINPPLNPDDVEQYVSDTMRPAGNAGPCSLFERR